MHLDCAPTVRQAVSLDLIGEHRLGPGSGEAEFGRLSQEINAVIGTDISLHTHTHEHGPSPTQS